MIAYNHYIKFIPVLKNEKKIEGSFADTIFVEESSLKDVSNKFIWELQFFNNQGRSLSLWSDRDMQECEEGQFWAFEVQEVVTFFWNSGLNTLYYIKGKRFSDALLKYWSLHIVLPVFFTVEERYDFLHAGTVEVEGKPVLFVAQSNGGKSTMTDYFIKQGHTMLSDDKVGIEERDGTFYAIASHPYQRPYRKMEDLGYRVENFSVKPLAMHTVYVLEKAKSDAEIVITELKGVEKFLALRYNSEINLFFSKPRRLDILARIANKVPVFTVTVPWDKNRLSAVYEAIVQHSKGIV